MDPSLRWDDGWSGPSEFLDALAVAGGAAEDLLDRVAGHDRRAADPDLDRHHGMADIERVGGDAARDPLGGIERRIGVEMVEQQREGAAAAARGDVAGTDQALEQPRDMAQRRIAGDPAMAVVDRLQILEIDRDQGRGGAGIGEEMEK